MEHNQNTIAVSLIINVHYGLNFMTILDSVLISSWPLSRGYFGRWAQDLVVIAVIERWTL